MFQSVKNSKRMQHIAESIQSLVAIGIKPKSIHFDERKTKVLLQNAPDTQGLGPSYRYSWGKDEQGQLFEMHMLPMRDINLIWKTFPRKETIVKSKQHRIAPSTSISRTKISERAISPAIRLSKLAGTKISADDISFGIAA
jgi:hypothetical protein